uniref:Uncharacterized protein n=1 Tax=Chaetoceros debilis TaxID=122233 RepID=A0A7S3V506_9STRA|eukprot:CAMPEP_0194078746 /NCGR_PEP_ID=MMETSP0149-20130528/5071_1 /TAXON_ID=122233 /ORGANISM="Chaetoceros debilis, Strain MM31A-1" /LENGTH=161 /DNA_ID=CAMNT_0038760061 /DNA_START=30 /DNA_END=515 /DNA_ORIENTATION=+
MTTFNTSQIPVEVNPTAIAFEKQLGAKEALSSLTAGIPEMDDSSDTSSLTSASTEATSMDVDEDKSNITPSTKQLKMLIWERLYNATKEKQLDGKQRRLEIEENIAKKHTIPDFSTSKKMSIPEAEEFYRKALRRAMERDEKLAKMRELETFDFGKKISLF